MQSRPNTRLAVALAMPIALLVTAAGTAVVADSADGTQRGLELMAIDYPQRDTTPTLLQRTPAAPEAEMIAGVNYDDGKARIALAYNGMRPAALFGGDVTTYVVWAIEPDGRAQNLGELTIRNDDDGRQDFTTPLKKFAMVVTAESHYLVNEPSPLVLFHTKMTKEKNAGLDPFTFEGFGPGPVVYRESIAGIDRSLEVPVDLLQARKTLELAKRAGGVAQAPTDIEVAEQQLTKAESLYDGGKRGREFREACRQSVTHSHQALQRAREASRMAEERREELQLQAAETRAAAFAEDADRAQARAEAAESRLRQSYEEQARLEAELSRIVTTRRTDRGLAIDLPDVLFDVDRANLRPEAEERLAEAVDILRTAVSELIVEGHADSTGASSYNMKLSEARARSVANFLVERGISTERIEVVAFGETRPRASNGSPDTRQQNRRVEIVVVFAS